MRAPAFWWERPGALAALLSPFAAIYGGIAARRMAWSGVRAGVSGDLHRQPDRRRRRQDAHGNRGRAHAARGRRDADLPHARLWRHARRTRDGRRAHTAIQVGDEPLLLARVAPTIVALDRIAGARVAKDSGASVIVMDDGFQNPSVAKELSVLVVDARGVGNGRVLPAGPLRAPARPAARPRLRGSDRRRGRIGARSAGACARLPVFHGVLEPEPGAVAALRGRKVFAFAGIGDPAKFFATLDAAGIDAPVRRGFGDHHRYSPADARALLRRCRQRSPRSADDRKDLARLKDDANVVALAQRVRSCRHDDDRGT